MSEWHCPVCGGRTSRQKWTVKSDATENGVEAAIFRPSADRYGETVGRVLHCSSCGHGSLAETPTDEQLAAAYEDAADPVSLDEEAGQIETGRRSLELIESQVERGALADIGCWTGSLVAAAKNRGWDAIGVEPSRWAVERAQKRGLDVRLGDLDSTGIEPASLRAVVLCDVIEHLLDVQHAIQVCADLLESGGALYLATPDAGGGLAKLMGARWWSVLPMHVQYFTRDSMRLLLESNGFTVPVIDSHPKVFTANYYARRLAGYSAALSRLAVKGTARVGWADRLVAPDFHDRMQVLAIKT